MMWNEQKAYDRLLFGVASVWNLGAALMLLVNPDFLLGRLGIHDSSARLLAQSFSSSVGTWGIGYGLIAINAKRFRDFAWLGVLSKTVFFLIYAAAFLADRIGGPAMAPALIDLVFAALFLEFLLRTRTKPDAH